MTQDEILKLAKEHSGFATGKGDEVLTVHFDVEEITNFANAIQSHSGEAVAEFRLFRESEFQASYCQFVFNHDFVQKCKEGDKVYAIPQDQSARIAELTAKCEKMRELLLKSVFAIEFNKEFKLAEDIRKLLEECE